ncbi:MAG: AAA family ATPase [Burkholderiaceae bacterium]
MGLLAHPFSSEAKDAFGTELKTPLAQVFRLSPEFDAEDYSYEMSLRTGNGEILAEPVSFYYVKENTNRHRIVVSGSEKGDGNFHYNTSFLNLKRLFPLVDTKAAPTTDQSIGLTSSEAAKLKDFYENIFPSTGYEAFVPVHQKKVKSTFALTGATARYDWRSISSGEDNLGAIFNRLVGFQRAFNEGQKVGNGILCIDEFESSLHPVAQLQLLDYLYRWSARYKVQVVISTHSLHLIQNLYLRHSANLAARRIVINFVSKSSARAGNFPILHNPDYELAYKELTMSSPAKVAAARKVRVFCEDEHAIHFAKRLVKSTDILSAVEFHSSLDPHGGKVGTSWSALRKLCVEYPLLLEGSLALFDADVGEPELAKIKNTEPVRKFVCEA